MPIFAQAVPGESVVSDTVNGAWDNLPPEAAALFIVLILLLVGGMFLSYTYMKTYGARVQEKKDEKVAVQQPQQTYIPGMKTLSLLNNLRGSDVREMALRDEPNKTGVDAAQEVKLDALKEKIDRLEKEIDNLRKWKERHVKKHERNDREARELRNSRTNDLINLSNRLVEVEKKAGLDPTRSTGKTLMSVSGKPLSIPPTDEYNDDNDGETLG
jgi:hypothetical protein